MRKFLHKVSVVLSPLLGTGGVGICPACVAGSAAVLSWLGLGFLVPIWRPIVFILFGLGVIGFMADFSKHKNLVPLMLLILGSWLLYVGRYVYGGREFTGWQIWLPGAVLTITAVILNRREFRHFRPTVHTS